MISRANFNYVLIIFFLSPLITTIYSQGNFCLKCDDLINDGCFSCDVSNDLSDLSLTVEVCPSVTIKEFFGFLCTGFAPNNTYWYGFVAGSSSITLEAEMSNCVTGGGMTMGILEGC